MEIPIVWIENPEKQEYPLIYCPICGQLIVTEDEYNPCEHVMFFEDYKLGYLDFCNKRLKRMVEYRDNRYCMTTIEALNNIGKEKSGVSLIIAQNYLSPSCFPEFDRAFVGFSLVRNKREKLLNIENLAKIC